MGRAVNINRNKNKGYLPKGNVVGDVAWKRGVEMFYGTGAGRKIHRVSLANQSKLQGRETSECGDTLTVILL